MLNPADIPSAISEMLQSTPRDRSSGEWVAVDQVTQDIVLPAIEAFGLDAVLSVLKESRGDPYVAAVLVNLSGDVAPRGGRRFRITEFFSEDEIADAALMFLRAFPDSGLEDGRWAWTALWNGWQQLDGDEHLRILMRVIQDVPWDDQILWMIGDGPLSMAASDPEGLAKINELEASEPKIGRMWRLVEVDWPHGVP